MRAPVLFCIILSLHVFAIGGFLAMQGCATRTGVNSVDYRGDVNPPMPPSATQVATKPVTPIGQVQPVAPGPEVVRTTRPRPGPREHVSRRVTPRPQQAASRPAGSKPYTVKEGDMISKIAQAHGVRSSEIIGLNQLANPDALQVGQVIYLPAHARLRGGSGATASSGRGSSGSSSAAASTSTSGASGGGDYVVRSGDTLGEIAQAHGSTVALIKQANGLSSDLIQVGQKLKVPKRAGSGSVSAEGASSDPEVVVAPTASGDSPAGTSVESAESVEPVEVEPVASPKPPLGTELSEDDGFIYTVQQPPPGKPNETIKEISNAFIVSEKKLRELNNLGPNDEVKPGDRIRIPPSEF